MLPSTTTAGSICKTLEFDVNSQQTNLGLIAHDRHTAPSALTSHIYLPRLSLEPLFLLQVAKAELMTGPTSRPLDVLSCVQEPSGIQRFKEKDTRTSVVHIANQANACKTYIL